VVVAVEIARRKRVSARDSGYTLLELLIVLAVVALLLTSYFALSSGAGRSGGLREISAEIVSDLILVRDAADRGATITVRFDARSWILPEKQPQFLPAGIAFAFEGSGSSLGGVRRLTFFSDGSVVGGPLTLEAGDARMTIAIDRLTGRITVGKPE
jgi:prepilin-type N-terminal cleavage/methylation domain-containing protein